MPSVPPLANLLAFRHPDPRRLDDFTRQLSADTDIKEIWRPTSQWVVAITPLPDSTSDPAECRHAGLAFIQGRENFDMTSSGRPTNWRTLSDSAHERPETLSANPGDFAFLAFGADHSVTAVRACGGVAPVYFWTGEESTILSTQMHRLSRALPIAPELDLMTCAIAMFVGSLFPDHRSYVKDVCILSRGEAVRLIPGRTPRYTQYWDPRPGHYPEYSEQKEQENAVRFRSILVDHLQRHVPEDRLTMLALSGGVDSCALAALLMKLKRPITTWTLLPSNDESERHERSFIDPLLRELKFNNANFEKARPELYEHWFDIAPKVAWPGIHLATGGLCELIKAGYAIHTMIGGEWADETAGCPMHTPDWSLATPPKLLLRQYGKYPRGKRDLLSWLKYRAKASWGRPAVPYPPGLPESLHPAIRADYAAWWLKCRESVRCETRAWGYLKRWLDMDGYLAMHWEYCSPLGVRRVFPFATRAMLELTYSCHPAELIGPGVKKLLKQGLKDDVPRHVLRRTDKGLRRPPRPSRLDPATLEDRQPTLSAAFFSARSLQLADSEGEDALYMRAMLKEHSDNLARTLGAVTGTN